MREKANWIAGADPRIYLKVGSALDHGIIEGDRGSGKSVTVKVMAEIFSDAGIPVFAADLKGDMSGLAEPGEPCRTAKKRLKKFGLSFWPYRSYPTEFFDITGQGGLPLRVAVSDVGPMLMAAMLDLTKAQRSVLSVAFDIADEKELMLFSLDDLAAWISYIGDRAGDYALSHGRVNRASIGAILRKLSICRKQGIDRMFGAPTLNINDWLLKKPNGQGTIHLLMAKDLYTRPKLYANFVLYLLSSLYETLPKTDRDRLPRMVFFFDEADIIFSHAPEALCERVTRVVSRLASRGVALYFVTAHPERIDRSVSEQLSTRITHRFFDNDLAVGEAKLSFSDDNSGQRAWIVLPKSRLDAADEKTMHASVRKSPLYERYTNDQKTSNLEKYLATKIKDETTSDKLESLVEGWRKSALGRAAADFLSSAGRELGKGLARGLLGTILNKNNAKKK